MIKVFYIANSFLCSQIKHQLENLSGYVSVGSANFVNEAVREQVKDAHIIIIEHEPSRGDSDKIACELMAKYADKKFILLLGKESQFWTAVNPNSHAYLLWSSHSLSTALEAVVKTGFFIDPFIVKYLLQGEGVKRLMSVSASFKIPVAMSFLSNREKEVLSLLIEGKTNKEIANELSLRLGTVKVHVNHILGKLGLDHRGQVISRLAKIGVPN